MGLTKYLLDLDNINSNGNHQLRAARKACVIRVQALLEESDALVKKMLHLKSTVKTRLPSVPPASFECEPDLNQMGLNECIGQSEEDISCSEDIMVDIEYDEEEGEKEDEEGEEERDEEDDEGEDEEDDEGEDEGEDEEDEGQNEQMEEEEEKYELIAPPMPVWDPHYRLTSHQGFPNSALQVHLPGVAFEDLTLKIVSN